MPELCSKCHEDFMNCKCDMFHPNLECEHEWGITDGSEHQCSKCLQWFDFPGFIFNISELQTIYDLVKHMYIPYENAEAHKVINKIIKILKENE